MTLDPFQYRSELETSGQEVVSLRFGKNFFKDLPQTNGADAAMQPLA